MRLRDLGKALIPAEYAAAARDRILYYFRKYAGTVINGDELLVVSGIQEYARRLRELRVQFGWKIVSGVTNEELRYVAGDKTEWARRVRELRTEFGWPIATQSTGRPDLGVGVYTLQNDRQSPEHDRSIPDDIRREVLRRDGYKCMECGWSHDEWNPSDPRHLELHHVEHHVRGGENVAGNLKTLCTVCHDKTHRREKKEA